MKWLLALISILVGFIALVVVVGLLLPVKHRVSASAHFSIGTVQLWEVVTNYGNYPTWRTSVVAVERLADRNGHAVWKEFESTNTGVPYETVESIIHRRLVRRIADLTLPYGALGP